MDLSKLPKLSQTGDQAPRPPESDPRIPPPIVVSPGTGQIPEIGADLWFNAIIGALLIFLGRQFAGYLVSLATGQPFHTNVNWETGPNAGQEVSYPQLQGFVMISDGGIFIFGLVVLLEAAVKALVAISRKMPRVLIAGVFALAIASTFFNLYACIRMMGDNTVPLISGLAVAFGGYIMLDSWRLLQAANSLARRSA